MDDSRAPLFHLHARLLAQPLQGRAAHARDPRRGGQLRQLDDRVDPALDELARLAAAHARHQREVVVVAPLLDTRPVPTAHPAVLDRVGVGGRRWVRDGDAAEDHVLEPRPDGAVVGHVVLDPEGDALHGAAAQDDVHPCRFEPLDLAQLLRVRAELEHGARLCLSRQLGVGDLVAPRAQCGRGVDAQQEVGVAAPPAVEERGLVDDVVATVERLERLGGCAPEHLALRLVVGPRGDRRDRPLLRLAEGLQVPRLVLESAASDHVQLGILTLGALHEVRASGALQVRQVLAFQEADQVGRGDDDGAVDGVHPQAPRMRAMTSVGAMTTRWFSARVMPT